MLWMYVLMLWNKHVLAKLAVKMISVEENFYIPSQFHTDLHLIKKKKKEVQIAVTLTSVMTLDWQEQQFIHYWNVPGNIQSTLPALIIYSSQQPMK